jgi:RNA polymerase sigma-70 factor (ECF subfamily)
MTAIDRPATAGAPGPPGPEGAVAGAIAIDWGAALAEHQRWLRTVVLARLRERQGVDEVMQEVSLAAVAQRAPLADPGKVAAWLYRIAVRQSLLHRRRLGRRKKLDGRFAAAVRAREGDAGPTAADPLDWLLAVERSQLVRRAVAHLPRRDAELLLLKYTEDWSYRDLAAHLGLTEAAVQARLHRVRQRLRDDLRRLGAVGEGP